MSCPIVAIRRLRAALLISGMLLIGAAQALEREPAADIDWRCVQEYDVHFHILCEPRIMLPADAGTEAPIPDNPAGTQQQIAAARAMLPAALRTNARDIAAQAWRVPLYNLPFDDASVTGLLKSVLCRSVTPCSVGYHATRGVDLRSMQASRSARLK